jgi:hypothetical protein
MPSLRTPGTPTFQPRISLGIVYVLVLFFVYCLIFVAPALYDVLVSVPPGPEQQELARQVAREVVRPRLPIALGAGTLTTLLGVYLNVLPGMRRRG